VLLAGANESFLIGKKMNWQVNITIGLLPLSAALDSHLLAIRCH
jgi:hypothetical protein